MLIILNRPRASRSSDFEITRSITPWIVLHSVQLLLPIENHYNQGVFTNGTGKKNLGNPLWERLGKDSFFQLEETRVNERIFCGNKLRRWMNKEVWMIPSESSSLQRDSQRELLLSYMIKHFVLL